MQPDPQASFLAARQCTGGFHGMVKLVNTGGNARNEMASGLGQPDATRMTLEQENPKVFLQCLDTCADAWLADAERLGSVAKIQVFGDSKRLDQRRKGNTTAENRNLRTGCPLVATPERASHGLISGRDMLGLLLASPFTL